MDHLRDMDDVSLATLEREAQAFAVEVGEEIARRTTLARRERFAKRGRILAILGTGWTLPKRLRPARPMEIGG